MPVHYGLKDPESGLGSLKLLTSRANETDLQKV